MEISSGLAVPAGGLVLSPPLTAGVTTVVVNGEASPVMKGHPVVVRSLPARVVWRP